MGYSKEYLKEIFMEVMLDEGEEDVKVLIPATDSRMQESIRTKLYLIRKELEKISMELANSIRIYRLNKDEKLFIVLEKTPLHEKVLIIRGNKIEEFKTIKEKED